MRRAFTHRFILIFTVPIAVACSNFTEHESLQAAQFKQLESAMSECLAGQSNSQRQQAAQQLQLEEVMATLTEIQREARLVEAPVAVAQAAAAACLMPETVQKDSKIIVGQREQVWLQDLQLALPARIDTGAETASLDARNIELFERNGKNWVRFEIVHPETGKPLPLERRLKRTAMIVQANSTEAERRPVIKLGITIGEISQSAEFNLSNRSHLDYQMLVGRNILKDVMIVDVSKDNLAPPHIRPPTNPSNGKNDP